MKKKQPIHPAHTQPPRKLRVHLKSEDRLTAAVLGLAAVFILVSLHVPKRYSNFDFKHFGQLPVLSGGRIKPIDTLARSSLLVLSGKQSVRHEGETIPAIKWFVEMVAQPTMADERPVFRIDDPDVLGLMNIQQTAKRYFSFAELHPFLSLIQQQASQAAQIKPSERSRFFSAVLNLENRIDLYQRLQNTLDFSGRERVLPHLDMVYHEMKDLLASHMGQMKTPLSSEDLKRFSEFVNEYSLLHQGSEFYPLPSIGKELGEVVWISPGQAMLQSVSGPWLHPGLIAYAGMTDSIRSEDWVLFNRTVEDYSQWLQVNVPDVLRTSKMEFRFNHAQPFYNCMILYVAAFFMVMIAWLTHRMSFQKAGYALVVFTFVIHTLGLILRMYFHGRPPVTNLYSSAIFVGWVAVFLGMILEKQSKKGFGTVVSSAIGFITLIIAHNLSTQGDTLEMMRAVLDSNFWLATHVVCVTVGYASTFLSGTLGIVYLVRQFFDAKWSKEARTSLERMAYGVVCFSLFFSFTGTILGGIWADQSWGRFWGWDPKENGALMIVLWNAFILHARWSKVSSEKDIMTMTVFGNVVTALSWFGVNMLGIGLHSYGFMDKAFYWLMLFIVTQILIIVLSYLPRHKKQIV